MKCNLIYALLLVLIGSGLLLVSFTDLNSLAISLLSFAVLAFPLLTLITQCGNNKAKDNEEYLWL
jgi:hypothetical protein